MGILFRNSQGVETPVAGLAPAGQLVPSVALYQKGSFEVEALPAGGYIDSGVISFQTPFPDTDYVITFDFAHSSLVAGAIQKTTSGFHVVIGNIDPNGGTNTSICYWKAFKLMTDEVTALDEAKIEQNTRNFANEFSSTSSYAIGDYTTYNGQLYRCIIQHTASAWNSSHFTATNVGSEIKGATIVKKGTWSGEQILYPMGDAQTRDRFNIPITFDTPMPDSNYTVIIEFFESRYITIRSASKTASGFHIEGANADNEQNSTLTKITWTAIRFPS